VFDRLEKSGVRGLPARDRVLEMPQEKTVDPPPRNRGSNGGSLGGGAGNHFPCGGYPEKKKSESRGRGGEGLALRNGRDS